jgi:hypothetical protein
MGFLPGSFSLVRPVEDGNGAGQERRWNFSHYCMVMQSNRAETEK